jgi:hypothetical protein
MKKLIAAFAAAVACLSFAGCATQTKLAVPTPQQLADNFCPLVNADLDVLSKSPLLSADQRAELTDKIIPANLAICQAGQTIVVDDLKTFNATIFPALVGLVAALPALPNQPVILLGLTLAQPILTQVINSLPVPTVTPPAAPSAPASSASTVLVS